MKDALQNAQASSEWIDALLALFWAVSEAVSSNELPPPVLAAYATAEAARQEL
jgi:hypothetical protein